MESSRKAVEDKCSRLFASWKAHLAELSESTLSEADMEAVADEKAQKHLDAEIQAINFRIGDIIHDVCVCVCLVNFCSFSFRAFPIVQR